MKDAEWWLRAAISDDGMVAELLLRLREQPAAAAPSGDASPHHQNHHTTTSFLSSLSSWGAKQPRSSVEKKRDFKETPPQRRSPTTPLSLSWCSPSDGCDDSSNTYVAASHLSDPFRSKVSANTDTPASTSRRPRRKKTFAELKEEEGSLLKERTYLKRELATLRLTLKEQRSINENLKRIKLDLRIDSGLKSEEANSTEAGEQSSNHYQHNGASEAASSSLSGQVKTEVGLLPDPSYAGQKLEAPDSNFVLPDLNMVPEDEGIAAMS